MMRKAIVILTFFAAVMAIPLPFTSELTIGSSGDEVFIAQNLLARVPNASPSVSGIFDASTVAAVRSLQSVLSLPITGVLDAASAQALLDNFSDDGIRDDGFTARSLGLLYKFVFPVHVNRSIETTATLFDADNNFIMNFTIRAHGHRDNDQGNAPWPDFGDGDFGLNQFSSDGATTTGIVTVDLNSPEEDPNLYGPYPINRLVSGLKGNAAFLLPNIRSGLLLHTGNWSTPEHPWDSSKPMPNSSGCLHAHPEDIQAIYKHLVALGVKVNPNPYASGQQLQLGAYPYPPQGVAVVQLVK